MRFLVILAIAVGLCRVSVGDEPKLELALHELAAIAKKAGHQKLVVVARLDVSSGQATDETLNSVEELAITALNKENGLKCSSHDDARAEARKARAKRALTTDEARVLKNTATSDAVVSLDYRTSKERSTVRLALSDGQKIQFAEIINLNQKIGGLNDLIGKKPPMQQPQGQGIGAPQGGAIGGNGGQLLQGVPPGATGYAIATAGGNPNFVRNPNAAGAEAKGEGKAGGKAEGKAEGAAGGKSSTSTTGAANGGGQTRGQSVAGGGGVAVVGAVGGGGAPAQPGAAATEVGQRILKYAVDHLGQQVGNGECWTLAADAMKASGAQPPEGYTFGDEIPLRSMRPGDILQFTSARFDEPGYYAILGAPNHTAVVYSIAGDRVFMLHQNFNGKRTVSTFDINLASLTSGRVQAYRPRAR